MPDLSRVNLVGAKLSGTDISGADLSQAKLSQAKLSNAKLSQADLYQVKLSGADLRGANLHRANLVGANLSRANLIGAKLRGANLSQANLSGANLTNVALGGTDLTYATFQNAILISTSIEDTRMDKTDLTFLLIDSYTASKIPENISKEYRASWTILSLTQEEHSENDITRSIKFEPEHIDAGMSILSYFGTIIRQKYKDLPVSVTIKREGLKVSMTIKTPDGMRDTIEKTLTQYGLVITGKMPPEDLLSDQFQILELANKLPLTEVELKNSKELRQIERQGLNERVKSLEEEVKWLRNAVGEGLIVSKQAVGHASNSTLNFIRDSAINIICNVNTASYERLIGTFPTNDTYA